VGREGASGEGVGGEGVGGEGGGGPLKTRSERTTTPSKQRVLPAPVGKIHNVSTPTNKLFIASAWKYFTPSMLA
jgi:hypothetical protein